jgi:uncharacterized protein
MPNFEGRFVWYELETTDVDNAMRFYRDVIGWSRKRWEGAGAPYDMFAHGEQTVAGAMKLPAGVEAPPHWLGYIATPDVDETAKKAASMGARMLVPPQDIPNIGRFSVMMDPQGIVIATFRPQMGSQPPESPRPETPQVGDFSWNELATTDVDAAFHFYGALFGWEKKEAHDMGGMIYQIFGTKEKALGGMYKKPADMAAPPHWMYYTRVANIDAAVEKVKTGGGKVLHGPIEVPGGDRVCVCMDPQGAAFALQS